MKTEQVEGFPLCTALPSVTLLYYVCTFHCLRVLVVYHRKDTDSSKLDKLCWILSSHLQYEMFHSDSVHLYLVVLKVNTGNVINLE